MNTNPPWRYRLLVRLLSPVLLAYTLWRTAKDGGKRYFMQRLGFYPTLGSRIRILDLAPEPIEEPLAVWIHAASVGEVFTALPLIKALLAHCSSLQQQTPLVLVTTGTPTGAKVLAQQDLAGVQHQYLPIDFPGACQRFLKQAVIREGWIVETEIWPWLYSCCKDMKIPLTLINGRLSTRTSKQANGVLASSYRGALSGVRVLARSSADAANFIALGAQPKLVTVVGNLKYVGSAHPSPAPLARQYVVAASTHADEELQLARHWKEQSGDVLLVIVPRHPERGNTIAKQLDKLGIHAAQRSLHQMPEAHDILYLADTLGELQAWYSGAKGAFVGGSLVARGGHNMLEPARFSCPTIVGPHTQNFDDIVDLMRPADAIAIAPNAQAAVVLLRRSANTDEAMVSMGRRGFQIARKSNHVLNDYTDILFKRL